MRSFFCVLLFMLFSKASAQVFTIDNSVPVVVDDKALLNPWAGGLNSGQYNTIDLNNDGAEDLVVFDRTNQKINVFLALDGQYIYDHSKAHLFPTEISNWLLLRDFNCDGLKDIFTSDPFGVRVYVNESEGDQISWRIFNSREPNASPLLTKGFSDNPINLQVNSSDLPSIEDLDNDGDLDILVFRFSSAATVEFHKNMSIENNASCDSLQFERITQTYGNFEECNCGSYAFDEETCEDIGGGRVEHQSGKSILALDMDGDGDKEVVIGEEECGLLSLLKNEGNPLESDMNSVTTFFPNNTNPVSISLFPAAYYEDVNFDGVKDLIVAPSLPANVNYSVDFNSSSWLYTNAGTNNMPSFEYVKRNFLQDEMLEVGENAAPAFYDYDNDGDLDLFLGSFLSDARAFRSTIKLYKNIGTINSPSFELENEDLFGLSFSGIINFKPQFVDIDSDGLEDLVFTGTGVSSGITGLFYLKRLEGNFQFDLSTISVAFSPLGINENIKVADIDLDGFADLLIGRSTGRLEYYKNEGLEGIMSYTMEDPTFYGLDFSPFRQNIMVEMVDLNSDGNIDMLTGDARGSITFYDNIINTLDEPLEGVTELVRIGSESASNFNFGSKIIPVAVNLFNEDQPSIVLGTGQGGLSILRNESATGNPINELIGLYPNPIRVDELLKVSSATSFNATIVNLVGQTVINDLKVIAGQQLLIDISELKEGLYLFVPEKGSSANTIRFVVTR